MTGPGPAGPAATPVAAARAAARAGRLARPVLHLRLAVVAALVLPPVVGASFQLTDLAMKIVLFATLVASYDILIGYTGIVSFGHAMFFGIGAYAVALALTRLGGPDAGHLAAGFAAGVGLAALLAVVIAAFSLRVQALFFAMITLAFAEFAVILAGQWSELTAGDDGLSPRLPGVLAVGYDGGRLLGVPLTGRVLGYYLVLAMCLGLYALMRRFVDSPLGRTLEAIRENRLRAEALGIPTFAGQLLATVVASVVATVVGGCYTLWVRYVNPESVLGVPIMLDVLLMVIIGGMGTLDGGLVGAAVLVTARLLLPYLSRAATAAFPGSALVQALTERWLLSFGILFILVVFFFPRGVLGTVREALARRAAAGR